ncbi:hypothetical protein [Streptomyces sp. 891-h]|uniref:hypothetical protein n=1 Tax=Streptomyces sp. 891-h TaxID=2720714 RepID=UPI001FAAAE77|nr:hypothetical protein [Streptomyces sp. 891-h]UNZ19701.1 hypothetical protein HC362_24335 [Streptomyces sp. 891-h]
MAAFTYTDLIELDLGKLKSAVDDWKDMVDALDDMRTMATDGLRAKSDAAVWKGANATVTKKFVTATANEVWDLHAEAMSIHAVLDDAHSELHRLQERAKELTREAKAGDPDIEARKPALLVIDGKDGTVRVSAMECRADGYLPARTKGLIDYYAEALTGLVTHAAEIDEATRDLLRKSHGSSPHNAGHGTYTSLDGAQLPRAMKLAGQGDGASKEEKAELRRLWQSLSPGARAELWEKHKDGLKDAGIFGPTVKQVPPDAGSGPHGSREPGMQERLTKAKMLALASGGGWRGWSDASRHMDHYLSNDGSPMELSVDKMMDDDERFNNHTQELVRGKESAWRNEALKAFRENGNMPVAIPVETRSKGFSFFEENDPNWYFAVGSMDTNVTGVVTVKADANGDPKVALDYQVNAWDQYNWDKGKGVNIGKFSIPDGQPASLHETGLAKEFAMSGSSSVMHRELNGAEGGGKFPEPDGPGLGRDGGRADPDRKP